VLFISENEGHAPGEDGKHAEIEKRKQENALPCLAGIVFDVLAEGNQTGERGERSRKTARDKAGKQTVLCALYHANCLDYTTKKKQHQELTNHFFSAAPSGAAVFYVGTCKFYQDVLYL
jgi:hypothetical protein